MGEPQIESPVRRGSVGVVVGGKEEIAVARGERPDKEIRRFRRGGAGKLTVRKPREEGAWQISFADELRRTQGSPSQASSSKGDAEAGPPSFSIVEKTADRLVVDLPVTDENRELLASLGREAELSRSGHGKIVEINDGVPENTRRFVLPRGVVTKK
ncbi:hypothetical protein HYT17_02060 [Candidatus Microgenomates bacterium]|nr:hypothetical protein [Candidatus Microgenomates bacterium]